MIKIKIKIRVWVWKRLAMAEFAESAINGNFFR